MTVREIQAHPEEMYGAEVSPSLISSVADAVVDEVKAWQGHPLDPVYPIIYLDCIPIRPCSYASRIYTARTAEEAEQRLTDFEAKWDKEHLPIGQSWRRKSQGRAEGLSKIGPEHGHLKASSRSCRLVQRNS